METEVKTFINRIKETMGIDLALFNNNGDVVCGDAKIGETVPNDINDVFSDVGLNRTIFPVTVNGKKYCARITGASKSERNYAYLITELFKNSFIKTPNISKEQFYKSLLFGELDYLTINKYQKKYIAKDGDCCAMLITVPEFKMDDVINVVETYNQGNGDFLVAVTENTLALVKFSDEYVTEYRSYTNYAEFIVKSVYEETGIKITVSVGGTVKSIINVSTSFSQALTTRRLNEEDGAEGSVHSFKEYILIKILEDLPKSKLRDYLELISDSCSKEIFSDEEMIETANEFLENSLNQSETARKLFLHRNTLTYRLDKIEKATGLDIRRFSDAVTFRIATLIENLVEKK